MLKRAWVLGVVVGVAASGGSCATESTLSANGFANVVVRGFLEEEVELQRVCDGLAQPSQKGDSLRDATRVSEDVAGRAQVLASALKVEDSALHKVLKAEVGDQPDAVLAVATRTTFAYATVLVLVRVSGESEGMVNELTQGMPFGGFFLPLLQRAAAEVVAAGLDASLGMLEAENGLSPAAVASEACRVYDRVDPGAFVTTRALRRAILRFSPKPYASVTRVGAYCKELGEGTCQKLLEKSKALERKVGTPAPDPSKVDVALQPPVTFTPIAPEKIAQRTGALEAVAKSCLAEHPSDPEVCSLTAIDRVASLMVRSDEAKALGFSALERKLDGIESGLHLVRRDIDRVDHHVLAIEARMSEGLREMALDQKSGDAQTKAEFEALRKLIAQPKTELCKEHVTQVVQSRNELARALELVDAQGRSVERACEAWQRTRGVSNTFVSRRLGNLAVTTEDLCEERFVSLKTSVAFNPKGSSQCTNCLGKEIRAFVDDPPPAFKDIKEDLVLIGYADKTPIVNGAVVFVGWQSLSSEPAFGGALPPFQPAWRDGGAQWQAHFVSMPDEERQRVLSLLRAAAVWKDLKLPGNARIEGRGTAEGKREVEIRIGMKRLTFDLATHCR